MSAEVLDPKTRATLQARAALLGAVLSIIERDGGGEVFVVSRGALCTQLDTPDQVDAWLKRAGGPKA